MSGGSVPIVSVVIPTFNGERFLGLTLASVLAQSCENVEIIVVDDGSSDRTLALVQSIAPQARCIAQANAGVSAARNRGLQEAHGHYVIFLDQDDVWHPTQLERQLDCLVRHPDVGAVVCPYQHWWPLAGRHPDADALWPPDPGAGEVAEFSGWVYHQFLFDCWALTSGTLLRRDLVLDARGFSTDLPFSEDWDLWLRLSRRTQFALLPWPPVLYRQHASQGSRRARPVDHRTTLLLDAVRDHGFVSADGRSANRWRFWSTIARYRAEFGREHLMHGSRRVGVTVLAEAWLRRPWRWRWLAQAVAGALGWRPSSVLDAATGAKRRPMP